jgi:hypothetical protein
MANIAVRGSHISGSMDDAGGVFEAMSERTIVGVERVGGGFEERV